MARVRPVRVSVGKPFPTGEECPKCGFDSLIAVLVFVNDNPGFRTVCGRPVCRKSERG